MKKATKRLASFLALAFVLAMTAAPAMAEEASGEGGGPVHTKTLWDRFREGGWVMWPILICSIGTVYLVWEGVNRTAVKKVAPPEHEEALKNFFRQGDYAGAFDFCKQNPSPLNNVLRGGISMLGEGKAMTEDAMMGELHAEQAYMSSFISYLSVMGVCTPMIGLLGTVTGMMRAFSTLETSGADPSKLSGAIGEVLVATASGLFIAIPAFMAFYMLRNRAAKSIQHIQEIINDLFRKMPYDALAGAHIGDDELYAALPAWAADGQQAAVAH